MILKFKSKQLKKLFNGDRSKVDAKRAQLILDMLTIINKAEKFKDLIIKGRRLHSYKQYRVRRWSLDVSGNVRIIFEWDGYNATHVDLLDPH